MRPRLASFFVLLLAMIVLNGCGSSGGGSSTTPAVVPTANVNVTVNWAARTRSLDGPASAQSLVLTLKNANPAGGDFAFTVNRDADPAAYRKKYTSPLLAKVGTWDIAARFYAQPGGAGAVVGTIDAQINLAADGSGIGDFTTTGTIATVDVVPGQTLPIGTATDIGFTAKDSTGAALAITPGSAKFTVTSGQGLLWIDAQGKGLGQAVGTAKVMVSVDGKMSAEQDVAVNYMLGVAISPEAVTVFTNGQQTIAATIYGAPAPTPQQPYTRSFDWSIEEGVNGGTIDSSGSYVAPNTPGTYQVVATSRFDATKRAVSSITVPGPATPNLPGIYVFSNRRLIHFDDMSGSNWKATPISITSFTVGPHGKIYYVVGSKVIRVDNLSGQNRVEFGAPGDGIGKFNTLVSVAIGPDSRIYLADGGNGRIIRIDDMTGANWISWNNNGQITSVENVFVASTDKIYFKGNGYISRIDDMLGTGYQRLMKSGLGRFCVTPDGHIYAPVSQGLVRFDDLDGSGEVRFGSIYGSGTGQFAGPSSVSVGTNGQIYIADSGNDRIVRIDDMTGKNWTTFGTNGAGNNQFQGINHLLLR